MKKIVKFTSLALASLSVLSVSACSFAQTGREQQLASRFAAADTDHDGKLTRSEAQAGMPRVASHFDQIDSSHLGYVTLEQIRQLAAQYKR
jgi:hypothetical protein